METEDSYDDEDGMFGQALYVEEDEDDILDLNVPPTTGNEYLRRVRMEASTCPKVVVADLDVKSMNRKQTVHVKQGIGDFQQAPLGYAPSLEWQNMQVADFAEQRQKLARYKAMRKKLKVAKLPRVPPPKDVNVWCKLCFGRIKPPTRAGAPEMQTDQIPDEVNSFPNQEGILPLMSVVVAMDQVTVVKVLEYHLNWFEVTGFTQQQGYWFYALLICLDKPLLPESCSLLRDLARAFSRLRASLGYWFYALLICLDKPLLPESCSLLRDLARAFSRLRASLPDWPNASWAILIVASVGTLVLASVNSFLKILSSETTE